MIRKLFFFFLLALLVFTGCARKPRYYDSRAKIAETNQATPPDENEPEEDIYLAPPTCTMSVKRSQPALVNGQIHSSGGNLEFEVTPSRGAAVISYPGIAQVPANTTYSSIQRLFRASVLDPATGLTGACNLNLLQDPLPQTPPRVCAMGTYLSASGLECTPNPAPNPNPTPTPNPVSSLPVRGKIMSVSTNDGLVGWVCERSNQTTLPGLELELSSTRVTIQIFQEVEPSGSEAWSECTGFGNPSRFRVPYSFLRQHAGSSIKMYAIPSFSHNLKVLLTDSDRYAVPMPPSGPTCTFSVSRQGTSSTCNISIQSSGTGANMSIAPQVNKQDPAPGGPWSIDSTARGAWNGTAWAGTVSCPIDRTSAISSYLKLQGGGLSQPCSGQPILVSPVARTDKPTCTFSVSRQGTTSTCQVSVQSSGVGTNMNVPPQVNKQDPVPGGNWVIEFSSRGAWSGSQWVGTVSCPTNRVTAFSSYLLLQEGGLSEACSGQPIVIPSVQSP